VAEVTFHLESSPLVLARTEGSYPKQKGKAEAEAAAAEEKSFQQRCWPEKSSPKKTWLSQQSSKSGPCQFSQKLSKLLSQYSFSPSTVELVLPKRTSLSFFRLILRKTSCRFAAMFGE
jgi:hypothetical protein